MRQGITATPEQQKVIDYDKSLVVIACPGSGKTFVMSEKVRRAVASLPAHRGVIAISFTNKASDELRRRSRRDGIDVKNSFFGTIDKFCFSEIITPFLKHLWGSGRGDLEVKRIRDLRQDKIEAFSTDERGGIPGEKLEENLEVLRTEFSDGNLILEAAGALALFVLRESTACRRYMVARYSHIFIDEYQDSDREQHKLFRSLYKLGLIAMAVGDGNQSIFSFSGKNSKFLSSLASDLEFKTFPVSFNHRSHVSIINYSLRIFDEHSDLIDSEERRVFHKRIQGNGKHVGRWIGEQLERFCEYFDVARLGDVGILTRSNYSGEIIGGVVGVPCRVHRATQLEEHSSLWAKLFVALLHYYYNDRITAQELLEEFGGRNSGDDRRLRKLIKGVRGGEKPKVDSFRAIAGELMGRAENHEAVKLLSETIKEDDLSRTFEEPSANELQIMTIHKAKGMEFDIVFHLDLYEWVLPARVPGPNKDWDNWEYRDWEEDLRLHYVAVTRAKKCCMLCSSTKRFNSIGEIKNGKPSEFLSVHGISGLRGTITDVMEEG